MARIKRESVEAVKSGADFVAVVEARTPLRKAGARLTGRCPFHEEKTPSFSVNPVDKLYYCFGCGAGGDMIGFVEQTENLDFGGAVEWLAERFRIPVEYEESSPAADAARSRRDRLYALLEQATAFYERHLWDSAAGVPVREYLAGRGISDETAREFRLGLSPSGASTLARKAAEKGFTREELAAAGLANRRGNDYFQQRLMFPLADARGRVVGFSARKLHENDPLQGKYVNSPEGELFHKSAILYGLHLARNAIAKEERAIVVEGQTDTIVLRQSGLGPVVAAMGTALTELQLKELSRFKPRLYLCFDADAAGEAAALRGMKAAHGMGFEVLVVPLDPGRDPADDPTGFQSKLGAARPYPVHGVRGIVDGEGSPDEKFVRAREFLAPIGESPSRQEALRYLADRLNIPREMLSGLAPARGSAVAAVSPHLLQHGDRLERDALAGVMAHPKLRSHLAELTPEHFDGELNRAVREQILNNGDATAPDEIVPLLAELDARAAQEAIDERTATELLLMLAVRHLERELAGAAREGDLERMKKLQADLARLRDALDEFR